MGGPEADLRPPRRSSLVTATLKSTVLEMQTAAAATKREAEAQKMTKKEVLAVPTIPELMNHPRKRMKEK